MDPKPSSRKGSSSRMASLVSGIRIFGPAQGGGGDDDAQPASDREPKRSRSLLARFRTPSSSSSSSSSSHSNTPVVQPKRSVSLLPSLANSRSSSPKPPLPAHHLPDGKGFKNPWPSAAGVDWASIVSKGLPIEVAPNAGEDHDDEQVITPTRAVEQVDWTLYQDEDAKDLVATWLGHAGMLVQLPAKLQTFVTPSATPSTSQSSLAPPSPARPIRLLFDPIFSNRAGPSQWTGPKRLVPSPCTVKDLPRIDFCFISHSHYDHLDLQTILDLKKHQPHVRYFVPLGLKAWFLSTQIPPSQIVEFDWWQSTSLAPDLLSSLSSLSLPQLFLPSSQETSLSATGATWSTEKLGLEREGRRVKVTCVPAQHKSGRTALDQDATLWCGWVVEAFEVGSPGAKEARRACVYHAGDTGYRSPHDPEVTCPVFRDIGSRLGPIDLSMIPIWRGGSLAFLSWAGLRLSHHHLLHAHHVSPPDALRLHRDVRSRHSVGVHHGCFVGSGIESVEALTLLNEAREEGVPVWADDDDEPDGSGATAAEGQAGPETEKKEEVKTRVKVGPNVQDEGGFGCVESGETFTVPLDRPHAMR